MGAEELERNGTGSGTWALGPAGGGAARMLWMRGHLHISPPRPRQKDIVSFIGQRLGGKAGGVRVSVFVLGKE